MIKKNRLKVLNIVVQDALPEGALGRTCRASLDSFFDKRREKKGWVINDTYKNRTRWYSDRYAFKDNGASILAVAHCDTVFGGIDPYGVDYKDLKVFSPELDDRLGVYIITHLLPRLGIKCDVLLTENEESCSSTAAKFETEKKYNWIMSWDRRGAGCVMYQYETKEMKKLLEKYDFKVLLGTYSDIADLYKLGVVGINFATGYDSEHTKKCFADLRCLSRQVSKFMKFYEENKDTRFESKAGSRYYGRYYYGRGYGNYDEERYGYYDEAGGWHYNGAPTDYYHYGPTTATSAQYIYKPICASCGNSASVNTTYRLRGRYLCVKCERQCKTCFRRYSPDQMYDETTCMRCQMSYEAQGASITHKCYLCQKDTNCVEFTKDTWVCADCIRYRFIVCDKCKSVMPIYAQEFASNIGVCSVCRQANMHIRKLESETKPKIKRVKQCEKCMTYFDVADIQFSVEFQQNLCQDCIQVLYGKSDKKTLLEAEPDLKTTETFEVEVDDASTSSTAITTYQPSGARTKCDGCGIRLPVEEMTWEPKLQMVLCRDCLPIYCEEDDVIDAKSVSEVENEGELIAGYGDCDICRTRAPLLPDNGLLICAGCMSKLHRNKENWDVE